MAPNLPLRLLRTSKIPKIWRRAKIIVLPKLNKLLDDPKGYRPVSLLCVPYKFMERLLHARVDPVIDPKLPNEQVGFLRGKSSVDQVTLLTNDIEDTFQAGDKAGLVFLVVGKLPAAVYNLLPARTVPRHSALFAASLLQILGQAQ